MTPGSTRRGARLGVGIPLALAAYSYAVYPMLTVRAGRARAEARPAPGPGSLPSMTVIVPAKDEQAVIEQKIADLRRQDYPGLDIVVVVDGGTDGDSRQDVEGSGDATADLARRGGARVIEGPGRGKSAAVNYGVAQSRSDIVCMTDANCSLAPGALVALAQAFQDEPVAVVTGAKTVAGDGARGGGEGLYWRLESLLKRGESAFGAAMGAVGECCAVRRCRFEPIPPDVINDDYHLACDALRRGWKVRYAEAARSAETVSGSLREEFERRSRIAAGTWQTTLQHLTLCNPRRGFVAVAFISHRVLRNLVVPPALVMSLLAACYGASHGDRLLRKVGWLQAATLAAAAAGGAADTRWASVPLQFVLVNAAQLRGMGRYLTRTQSPAWHRAARQRWTDFPVDSRVDSDLRVDTAALPAQLSPGVEPSSRRLAGQKERFA